MCVEERLLRDSLGGSKKKREWEGVVRGGGWDYGGGVVGSLNLDIVESRG